MSVPIERPNDPTPPADNRTVDELLTRDAKRALAHNTALEESGNAGAFGLVPNLLTRFSLIPTKSVGDATSWTRQNDYANVAITAGWRIDPRTRLLSQVRVPRGGMANLALLWVVDQARRNLDRQVDNPERINLGHTLNTYLNSLGVQNGGRNYKLARVALRDVLSASIQLVDSQPRERGGQIHIVDSMLRGDLAATFELWEPNGNELDGFEPHAIASPFLLQLAADSRAVPVRMDVLAQLADSVIAQQALTWLTLKVWTVDVQQTPFQDFTWDELFRNITHSYGSIDKFRTEWKKQLTRVIGYFPDLQPYIDLAAVPEAPSTGNRGQRVIRIKRGARPITPPKSS